ncbi:MULTISPECIES: energy transducer TonB [unclassified Pseudomonas]|uniref:energy transducer TonB n=1 Tax=unclassified Pseudomonas TaxID=196821 RepID=UPI0011B431E9|nr:MULTISPECIES: hypothetical protein [unclassified Pseudomonas]
MQFIRKLAAVCAVLLIVISISACQTQQGSRFVNAPSPDNPYQVTRRTASENTHWESNRGHALEVFPDGKYNFVSGEAKNCVLPAIISVGESVYPQGVNPTHQETVKVALIVSSKGEVLESKMVSATNRKFVSAAINMAGSMKFRPMMCDGKSYDYYLVAPMIFLPREERSWLGILFSL